MRIFADSGEYTITPRNQTETWLSSLQRGQRHAKAKLSDSEVELIRELREVEHWTYGQLARKFEVSKNCIVRICKYRTR